MPTTINKQRVLNHLISALKSRHQEQDARNVLGDLIYAICREASTCQQADVAFRNLQDRFFDWNEIRVSSPREVAEALAGLPNAEERAVRLIHFLQEVFETTYSFDLDALQKKGTKQAAKQLSRYEAVSDYTVAWVVQHSLGGHAIPLDNPSLRVLKRLGLLEADNHDPEAVRTALEHLVPKARAAVFTDLVSSLADEFCTEREPACSSCPMVAECPTGQESGRRPSSGRGHRSKPR
jgi:endonuclease-3